MSKATLELTTFRERVDPLLEDAEEEIQVARDRVQELQSFKDELAELSEHAAHFDSVACGTLDVDEQRQQITLVVSKPTLSDRIKTVLREHDWTTTEIEWIEEAGLFQAELTMEYEL